MRPMLHRTADEGAEKHSDICRIYEGDWCHGPRVEKVREWVKYCNPEDVIELGCGTGDVSGPLSDSGLVLGYDISQLAVEEAKKRFPKGTWMQGRIDKLEPMKCGTLVLSETLEHLTDPIGLVTKWLPKAEYAVISHPLDEDVNSGLSAGEHMWSLSRDDMKAWFAMGGHELVEMTEFEMGSYVIGLARGKRASGF